MKYPLLLLLLVSCAVSYGQDSTKKNRPVALDSVTVLNTGYQSIARDRATGSFTHIDNATLNLQVGPSILSRLESVASGVVIAHKAGGMPPITVRGLSTINGNTAPLVILDNFPYEGDINAINPNLIESVTLLKDATAASIWGTRAGNGVIVITTKKGKYYQPLSIDFNSSVQVTGKPDPYALHSIAPADYVDLEQFLYAKGYYTSQLTSSAHPVVSPVVELLDRQSRGLISAADANAQIAAMRNSDIRADLRDHYYRPALNQQYAINFRGGGEKMAWLAGGGYDFNLGSLSETMERKSLRLDNSFTPLGKLRISTSLQVTGMSTQTGKDGYGITDYLYPYSKLYNDDSSPTGFARAYRGAYTDTLYSGKLLDWNYYPTEDYKHHYTSARTSSTVFNIGAQYPLYKGFSIDLKYQSETQHVQQRTLSDAQSYNARFYVNEYSQVSTAGVVTYNIPLGGILDINNTDLAASSYRGQLNYSGRWGLHRLTALAGSEVRSIHHTAESYRTYGYDNDLGTAGTTDFRTLFTLLPNGDRAIVPGGENQFTDQLQHYVSFYCNAAYSYDGKYTLTGSMRRDASNLFGVNTNGKWTPLWSVGGGWLVSKAEFYHSRLFPFLKLRASFGYTGNADPTRSGVVTVYANGNSTTTGLTTYRIRQFPNPDLRWEQDAITNFGLDFGTTNNRISGTIEYYRKKGIDLFANVILDQTTGVSGTGIVKNVADMKGKGVDLMLNSINTRGQFRWTTNLLFSYNTDRVTASYLLSNQGTVYVNDGSGPGAVKDHPVHSVMSLYWGGLDASGNPQGYLNGKLSTDYNSLVSSAITVSDLQYNGPGLPQFFGSVTNAFSCKGFELSVNVSYKLGYYFKRKLLNYAALFLNDRLSTDDYARRWQKPGDEAFTDVPAMVYPNISNRDAFYTLSSAAAEKGDHIRLQFVNLAYTIPLRALKWRLQCFANGSNLGILWRANKKGLDPDYATTDLPPTKAFALGIKLFFQ